MALHLVKARHKLLLMAAGAITLVLIGAIIGVTILLSGIVSIEATKQHFGITHRLLDVGLKLSVRHRASDITAPQLTDPQMIVRGAACFRQFCVQCHGSPGMSPQEHAKGLLPTPSNLAQTAREWPAEWMYYVTKRGVRMTGMPAWEYRLTEDSLWATTAFLKQLPQLEFKEYLALERRAIDEPCPELSTLPRDGSTEASKVLFLQYACHSCHVIEGVVGPETRVGPPLTHWSRRGYVAGVLPNTRDNLAYFIREPHVVAPGTLMPDLDVAESHARQMAAYLMSLPQ